MLAGVATVYIQKLKSVQNIAARMVSGVRRSEQITSVLVHLHWLRVSQRVDFKTALAVWKCVHAWCRSSLSQRPLRTQVVSICDLQQLALYWFHAPGLQLDNEVSQSTDQPHGTVCHQHYGHRTCRRAPSSGHLRRTCSQPSGAIKTSS